MGWRDRIGQVLTYEPEFMDWGGPDLDIALPSQLGRLTRMGITGMPAQPQNMQAMPSAPDLSTATFDEIMAYTAATNGLDPTSALRSNPNLTPQQQYQLGVAELLGPQVVMGQMQNPTAPSNFFQQTSNQITQKQQSKATDPSQIQMGQTPSSVVPAGEPSTRVPTEAEIQAWMQSPTKAANLLLTDRTVPKQVRDYFTQNVEQLSKEWARAQTQAGFDTGPAAYFDFLEGYLDTLVEMNGGS